VSILTAGCGLIGVVHGSGHVIDERRDVSGFDAVSLRGSGRLEVVQGDTESLSVSADDNILPLLTSEVRGTELVLGVKSGTSIDPSKDVVYRVGARNLAGISSLGSGSASASGIHTGALRVNIAGSGDISAEGTSDRQEITVLGSGNYRAADLQSNVATVHLAGSGDAILAVSGKLDVSIAGSGSVTYSGDPVVSQHILGSGSVAKQR
jgi:hypothetical protein